MWNTSTGAEVDRRTLVGNVFITGAVARERPQLMLGTGDGSLILWNHAEADADLQTGIAHGSAVDSVTLGRTGEVGISGGRDNLIKIWDIETFSEIRTLKSHSHRVTGLKFDGVGRRFVSGSFDRTVRIWDLDRPAKYAKLRRNVLAALVSLGRNERDGDAWNSLGAWHAFRGFHRGAITCFQRARQFDAAVSPLVLARCYWQIADYDKAEQEFEQAIEHNEAPKYYLQMCLDAIRRSKASP